MMKTMMAIAAFALGIGNAQARLGWTLDDCQSVWGSPVAVQYNAKISYRVRNWQSTFIC
jgi:hypothetical protein